MAHVYKTEKGKWRVLIEKRGVRKSATWETEREANAWAKRVEAEIELEVKLGSNPSKRTFKHAAERYLEDVSQHKHRK
jgi:hypothetical protein